MLIRVCTRSSNNLIFNIKMMLSLSIYNWYYMPSCHFTVLPIAQHSEDGQESRNKNNKKFRLHHAWKCSRIATNEQQTQQDEYYTSAVHAQRRQLFAYYGYQGTQSSRVWHAVYIGSSHLWQAGVAIIPAIWYTCTTEAAVPGKYLCLKDRTPYRLLLQRRRSGHIASTVVKLAAVELRS